METLTDREWDIVFDRVYDSYVERIIKCLRRYGTLSLREERMLIELVYMSPCDYEWNEAFGQHDYSIRIFPDLVTYVSEGAFRFDYIFALAFDRSAKKEIVMDSISERSIVFRKGGRRNLPHLSDRHFYYLMRLVERMADIAAGKRAEDMLPFGDQMTEEGSVLTDDYDRAAELFVREDDRDDEALYRPDTRRLS